MIGARRCGYRKPGKAYFVIEVEILKKTDLPVMFFIQDPPEPIDMSMISSQGITVLPRVVGYDIESMQPKFAVDKQGRVIHDVYDYVGGDYPNTADFVEEYLTQGISRLTPRTSDFGAITYDSEYRLVHPKAVIVDPRPFFKNRVNTGRPKCPRDIEVHKNPTDEWVELFAHTCAGLWWEAVTEDDGVFDNPLAGIPLNHRLVKRIKADGDFYIAAKPPEAYESQPGIFMRFPIGKLGRWEVIKSEDQAHEEAVSRLRALKDGLFGRTRITDV